MGNKSDCNDCVMCPNVQVIVRWFKFTLKQPYTVAHGNLLSAIWDTSP